MGVNGSRYLTDRAALGGSETEDLAATLVAGYGIAQKVPFKGAQLRDRQRSTKAGFRLSRQRPVALLFRSLCHAGVRFGIRHLLIRQTGRAACWLRWLNR